MKVVAINGSPHQEGNTWHSLQVVGKRLQAQGIDFEVLHIGHRDIHGCIGCGKCREKQDERCSIKTDILNETIPILKEADGILLASPVYCSGIAGTMKCYLDRLFYASAGSGNFFRHKVGAAVVSLRRTGGSHALDGLYHYLTYSEMQVVTSNYWNVIHGRTPGEIHLDAEGVATLEVLGDNMAWQLKMREATKDILPEPVKAQKVMTHFVREDLKG